MTTDKTDISQTLGLGTHKKRVTWRKLVLPALVLAGLAIWALVSFDTSGKAPVYVTEPVTRADLKVTVSANGTVEPTDLVEVSSELSGTISAVHVDFNDPVDKGAPLATLDTSRLEATLAVQQASLAAAEAKVAIAAATLQETRDAYDRGVQLERRGIETLSAFEAQEAAFRRAQAEVLSANASRDLAQANVDLVQVDLNKACICSPVKGVVLERNVDAGQIVAASLSAPILFTIAEDLARMELQVDIDEADIGAVQVGQSAIFTVDAYDDREFPADIKQLRLASETLDGVVTYKGILTIDNTDMALRPGMTATADIIVASVQDALVVPNAALRYAPPQEVEDTGSSGGGLVGMILPRPPGSSGTTQGTSKTVWVLQNGQATEVPVETGASDGSHTAILSGDLGAGDQVITDRFDAN